MKLSQPSAKRQKGFTLIELSIVLVIIGLIVGGVLVGQDLIKAAELRATIGQLEKYNAAVNTFRGKFGGIPGDLQSAQASAFGLFNFTGTGIGMGDGNGLIEASSGTNGSTLPVGETLAFWRHLSDANLIDGAFGSSGASAISASAGTVGTVTNVAQSLPPAKLGRGNYVAVYSENGSNDYEINGITGIASSNYSANNPQMTPQEAYNVDAKLDDGMPMSGNVRATGSAVSGALNKVGSGVSTGATGCALGTTTTDNYTRTNASPACGMRFRFN